MCEAIPISKPSVNINQNHRTMSKEPKGAKPKNTHVTMSVVTAGDGE